MAIGALEKTVAAAATATGRTFKKAAQHNIGLRPKLHANPQVKTQQLPAAKNILVAQDSYTPVSCASLYWYPPC